MSDHPSKHNPNLHTQHENSTGCFRCVAVTAHEEGAAAERAAIVTWLLRDWQTGAPHPSLLARQIERGDHLRGEEK